MFNIVSDKLLLNFWCDISTLINNEIDAKLHDTDVDCYVKVWRKISSQNPMIHCYKRNLSIMTILKSYQMVYSAN